MIYKIVSPNDYAICNRLLDDLSTYKYPRPDSLVLRNYYFDPDASMFRIHGCYKDDKLIACVFIVFSNYDKSWSIEYIVKDSSATIVDVVGLLDYSFDLIESGGFNTCYVTYFEQHDKGWERLLMNRLSTFNRYNITTEAIIPENKRSSFYKYWRESQKCIIYKRAIKVKMYSLKEQFRIF